MSGWPGENFLLGTPLARSLFHDVAAALPIVDFHCHLDPRDIADNRRFSDLASLWVVGDPYKHRAMRLCGVSERQISGDAPPREKFDRWACTVPRLLGNPLFDWSAMELKRYFGIDQLLSPATAEHVWQVANQQLAQPTHRARSLLRRMNVRLVCTSDRLLDDLSPHGAPARDGDTLSVRPSLRGDDVLEVHSPDWSNWLGQLARATGRDVARWDGFEAALRVRLDAFESADCTWADLGLDGFAYSAVSDDELATLYERRATGQSMPEQELARLKCGLLRALAGEVGRRGWTLQLHIGAQRFTSSRLRQLTGPQGGYACADHSCDITSLCRFMDDVESRGPLPGLVLYTLNPVDYAATAILTGSFSQDGTAAKVRLGPAWWFNDHALGITQHLDALSSYSLLSTFIGMTTDSRSLLSMVRHEYFRRVFCQWVGAKVQAGLLPDDRSMLDALVTDVCHHNAARAMGLADMETEQRR